MNISAPEEIELDKKLHVLERLKDKLAFREEAMTELRAELEQFEANYTMEVSRLYAELDEIEAQIAEEELKLVPDDKEIKNRLKNLRDEGKLTPEYVDIALHEIRMALLEADVNYKVAKDFVDTVRAKAEGQEFDPPLLHQSNPPKRLELHFFEFI